MIAIIFFFFIRALYCQCWFSSIIFSQEILPLDALNIFVSGVIAVWLGWYITRKLTEQRFLKEFIIKDICRIEEQIESFEKLINTNNATLQSIFAELNDLKHKIERFDRTTKLTLFSCNDVNYLNIYHTKLYKISTEEINLPADSRNELQSICDDFVVCLRKIVCKINNM
ncbi:MAG: hypothetical protein LBR52_05285 [Prevotellaceae bacterium]|nr:hypothetical protein [Prevotellaceae bacterium]